MTTGRGEGGGSRGEVLGTGGGMAERQSGPGLTKAPPLLSLGMTRSPPSFLMGSRLQEDRALVCLILRQQAPEPLGTKSMFRNFC